VLAQPLPTVEDLWAAAQLRAVLIDGPGTALNAMLLQHASPKQVEQEFRLTGLAARYRLPDMPAQAKCLDTGHPYATRLLVRRPADPAGFNGTVLVEWLNVSAGQDLDFVYAATRELILRAGYAWVGVSAQRVGVERLVAWNPLRYAGLCVAAPLDDPDQPVPLDPAQAFTGAAGGDVLCWDIYSHVALLLRRSPQVLGLPAVGHLVAAGESQSAFRLTRYFNTLQPKLGLFDGFLLYDRGGPEALRTDVPAKVISMGSEFFSEYAGAPPSDSDNQRWWELAGASHVSLAEMADYIDPQVRRDGVLPLNGQAASLTEVMSQGAGRAKQPLWSRVPNGDLMKAALHALGRWMGQGQAPPCAPRLQLRNPATTPGNLLRDAQGCSLGGVRYAAYEVPASVNVGVTQDAPKLAGYHLDFTPEEMTRRYRSAARYLAQVKAVVEVNVTQGFLLAEDAQRVLHEASTVRFND
jgi:hypothetical protein